MLPASHALAAGGGGGGSCTNTGYGGGGGSSSATGAGGIGGPAFGCGGGGGGGAGVTGGAGGGTDSAAGGAGGGSPGASGNPGANFYFIAGGGGGGGGGAHGAVVTTSSSNTGNLTGGSGGNGGGPMFAFPGAGGGGGGGGYGVVVDGSGLTYANTGAVKGGNGGDGGFSIYDVGGLGGNGGDGIVFTGVGTLVNSGSIAGGNGGAAGFGSASNGLPGLGGTGIVGASLSIVNSGSITGGLRGDGTARANAISFTSGSNVLELQAGSIITGNVVGTYSDTLRLGGASDSAFDVSLISAQNSIGAQYQGFSNFVKTGTSIWTLTGTTAAVTPWTVDQGTLAISSDSNLGDASAGLVFNGGTLQFLAGLSSIRSVRLNAGGGSFDTNGNGVTLAGRIDGAGNLTKAGTGTLTLTNTNTYTGGTTISAGTLQLGNGGTTGSITGDVLNNGALVFNRSDALTFSGSISGGGAVNQRGSGTTILTGSNSYAGDTTISAGTLQFGDGSSAGGSSGNVGGGTGGSGSGLGTGGSGGAGGNGSGLGTGGSGGTGGNGSGLGAGGSGGAGGNGSGLGTGGSGGAGGNGGGLGTGGSGGAGGNGSGLGTGGSGGAGGNGSGLGGTNSGSGNNLGGNLTVTGGTLAVVTPSTLNVAHDVTFADNTALSIVAGANSPVLSAQRVTIGNGVALNLSGIGDASQLDRVLIDTLSGIGGDFGAVTAGGFNGTVDYLTLSTRKSADNLQYLASYGLSWMANNNLAHGTFTLTNASDTFTVGAKLTDQAANPVTGWDGRSLMKTGAGTLILSEDNAYTGGTTIVAGTLQLGNGGTTGSIVGDVVDNGVLVFNRSDRLTFAENISGSGVVRQTGSGTTILTGNNTYGGDTTVTGGRLQFGDGGSGGSNNVGGNLAVVGGTLAIEMPATLSVAHNVSFADNTGLSILDGTNNSSLTADAVTIGNGVVFNIGGVNDAGHIDKVVIDTRSGIGGDFGMATVGGFNGTVDYMTLSTRKSADNLQYLASYGLSWMANNNLAHGTFTLTNASDTFTVGAKLTDQAANPVTGWDGRSLTKAGVGKLILTGDNTYTGGTALSGGVLSVSRENNLGGASGALTFGGGTLQVTGTSFNSTVRAINWGANGGGFDIADASNIFTVDQPLAGGRLTKSGAGTLVLTGDNTYTGGTALSGGVLSVSSENNLGGASGALTFGGGTLQVTGTSFNSTVRAINWGANGGGFDIADASNIFTVDQPLAGGRLTKFGAGTLVLTGDNTYTGGTTIVSGALQLGNGGATGSITGDVVNNGTLVFNRATDLSFGGAISGSGLLRQIGSGKAELTGDSSGFTGSTEIGAGMLAVNGKLGGTLDVLATGRLQGSGTVGSAIVSGIVAPGNSIGTINVAGNVAFNPGSIYEVEVNAAGASDKIAASGMAAINGGSVKVVAGMGNYAPATTYTILTANGGRHGTFAEGVTSNLAFLDPSLSYDANSVYLTMTRNNVDFGSVGLTANQTATGGSVGNLGLGNPVYNAMLNLSAPQVEYAFDQLSGEIHASTKTAMIEDSRFIRSAINDRIRAAFDSVGASKGPVVTYENGVPHNAAANSDRFAIWGQGFGSWGHSDGSGNASDLSRSTSGFFMGADAPVFDTWRFGAVLGYSRGIFDVKDRRSSGWSDSYHIGIYGGTTWGKFVFRTGAAYTRHDIATSRSVFFPGFGGSFRGDYHAGTSQVFGEVGYGSDIGAVRFEPFAHLAYVNLRTDGFVEKGGSAALASAPANMDVTFTTLGLRAATTFAFNSLTVMANGMLGWRYAFGDGTPLTTMRFTGGGDPFTIGGVPIARDAMVVEAGLHLALTPAAMLGITYGGQFGSGMSDQSLKASFNVTF